MADYGTDFSTFDASGNLTLDWSQSISGSEAVIQCAARRLHDAPGGFDLTFWVNRSLTGADLGMLSRAVCKQVRRDERVADVQAQVTQPDRLSLKVELFITLVDDGVPFRKVLTVGQLSVSILEA